MHTINYTTPGIYFLLNACGRVADVMIFTFFSLMPVHNVCRSTPATSLYNNTDRIMFMFGHMALPCCSVVMSLLFDAISEKSAIHLTRNAF